MADKEELTEKIQCLECGKYFSFLSPHLNKAHQMNAREYRERWGIPLHTPLASVSHSRQCRENVLSRIRRGEINPDEQLALMAEGRKRAPERATSTRLHKAAARNVAQTHQIWKRSPVVKVVPEALKAEAVKRMEARKVTGEKVKAIAADLNLSVGCLYKWVSATKQTVN
ncbi:MucR family transcriptional regulator [Klebsiella pneumoniae]|uniref:MucR family transcriptional regulator n=1 Tax=Klebsiella pneumoniae TaxID=573 RepID=UPI00093A69F5|nr:MucR family transcriptional regulator [Klebsiella pneumoniae]EKD6824265.1 MucR family transcriptional regulator [Salmonella enterica]OKL07645.1 ROS/MUCR transcriptional regulator domain protein [Klebsiella pneumoniae]OKL11922.1 ROS/MUCR transcriptional regulator domain protein [Klebsiella pneumoniae]